MSLNEETVCLGIAQVFQEAQMARVGHKKLCQALRKVQSESNEELFNLYFVKLLSKVLPLKKGDLCADNVVRFVTRYVAMLSGDFAAEKTETDEDTWFHRFIHTLVRYILRGIEAKDKNVRFRVIQLLANLMTHLNEIDNELYDTILWSLTKRVHDKEPSVRVQTVLCLSRFQDDTEASEASELLVQTLQNDASSEVRRVAMLHLTTIEETRKYILERARDGNSTNRRMFYAKVVSNLGDFRKLGPDTLDTLLHYGLNDREEIVSEACSKMFAFDWLNAVDGSLIDLLKSLKLESDTAALAMQNLFRLRPELVDQIQFPDTVWDSFARETSFLLKCYYMYCLDNKPDLLDALPETQVLSEIVKRNFTLRVEQPGADIDFILEQLLEVAQKYDYGDESGRRSMLNVVRFSLTNEKLTSGLVKRALSVLRTVAISEKDFLAMATEIITDIRDSESDEFVSAVDQSERDPTMNNGDEEDDEEENDNDDETSRIANNTMNEDIPLNIMEACLVIALHMLELISTPISQNITISSIIETLIMPAIRVPEQHHLRELGVQCLGLCGLLDIKVAAEQLYIFGMCMAKGHDELKAIATKCMCDLLSLHGNKLLNGAEQIDSLKVQKLFYKMVKKNDSPHPQAVAAEALCKLFLNDIFNEDDLFETLILQYFTPHNTSNPAFIQALTFCLPVYAFSQPHHQERIGRLTIDAVRRLFEFEEDVSMTQVIQQLIHWTDPTRVVNQAPEYAKQSNIHLQLAYDLLSYVNTIDEKQSRKVILSNLYKLVISEDNDYEILTKVSDLASDTREFIKGIDVATRNSLNRFVEFMKETVERAEIKTEAAVNEMRKRKRASSDEVSDASEEDEEDEEPSEMEQGTLPDDAHGDTENDEETAAGQMSMEIDMDSGEEEPSLDVSLSQVHEHDNSRIQSQEVDISHSRVTFAEDDIEIPDNDVEMSDA